MYVGISYWLEIERKRKVRYTVYTDIPIPFSFWIKIWQTTDIVHTTWKKSLSLFIGEMKCGISLEVGREKHEIITNPPVSSEAAVHQLRFWCEDWCTLFSHFLILRIKQYPIKGNLIATFKGKLLWYYKN